MRLTDYGRRQAFMLNPLYEGNQAVITHVHSSDLQRCIDTAYYALGFPANPDHITHSRLLREINFGTEEGLHFDSLQEQEKERISSKEYKAEGGESWSDVKSRMEEFFGGLDAGNHLVFSHGGAMASVLQDFGVEAMPNNGSIAGVTFDD